MFQSHLDEEPVMTMTSGLGQEPAPDEPMNRDVSIPQATDVLGRYKPAITIVLIAIAAYLVMQALKKKKIAPEITG